MVMESLNISNFDTRTMRDWFGRNFGDCKPRTLCSCGGGCHRSKLVPEVLSNKGLISVTRFNIQDKAFGGGYRSFKTRPHMVTVRNGVAIFNNDCDTPIDLLVASIYPPDVYSINKETVDKLRQISEKGIPVLLLEGEENEFTGWYRQHIK